MNIVATAEKLFAFLKRRRRWYLLAFKSPAGQEVLIDLAKFCRANTTTFHSDPRIHAALEGRREVWLRIINHLNLTDAQLFALYGNKQFNVQVQEEEPHE